jgi:hypothetical protein
MLPSIRTSFSWFSWKDARGTPNCFLSFRYLLFGVDERYKVKLSPVTKYQIEWWCVPVAHIEDPHRYADWLPCHHNARNSKHLLA